MRIDDAARRANPAGMSLGAPFHVVHLLPTPADGGVRRYVQQCCSLRGVRSTAIALFATDEPSSMDIGDDREIRLDIPLSRHRETRMIEGRLAAAVRRLKPDLLHSHHLGCDIFSRLARLHVSSGRMIRHVHGMLQRSSEDPLGPKGLRMDWTPHEIARQRRVESFVHRTICVSQELRLKLSAYGLPRDKLVVLSNAVDDACFKPPSERARRRARRSFGLADGDLVFGFLGRIDACKNAGYLVALARPQHESGLGVRYLVAGSGPLEAELKSASRGSGVSAMFCFAGHQSSVHDFYAAVDAVIVPSYTEGSPFVVLEAMASGVPVMAAAVGGICEILRDGIDGLLFDPKDIASGLAASRSLSSAERRHALTQEAQKRAADSFGVEAHRARLHSLYLDALREPARG